MSLRPDKLRRLILALGLVLSVLAAIWVAEQERGEDSGSAVVGVAADGPRASSPPAPATTQSDGLDLQRLAQRTMSESDVDPFRTKSWFVPPPPPPPLPPPVPTAPPLPFQFVGKSEDADGANLLVFLARGNESFTLSPGEKFDGGVYQFEGLEKGSLVIKYLPLATKQRLSMGMNE